MGWLLLLPLIIAFWLAVIIANGCVKKGGSWRILGILSSLAIGGISILVGYSFGIEGSTELRDDGFYTVTYPVLGWAGMIGGGLIAVIGIWTSLAGTKEEIASSIMKCNTWRSRKEPVNLSGYGKTILAFED